MTDSYCTVDMDNIKNFMIDIIRCYFYEYDIDEKKIRPQIWNDIIDEINEKIFKRDPKLLKITPCINNEYDMEKVFIVYNIYRRLCNSHCQVVNMKGFSDLTGITKQTLFNWAADSSHKGFDFHDKIMADNAQSLESMLHDPTVNPMKVLPSLNRHHGWAQPGVTREVAQPRVLGVADLPQLGGDVPESKKCISIKNDV